MSQRKQYIIDKKFQLKTTFSIIGVVSIITAIIVGIIAVNVVYNNTKIQNIYEIEDNIVHFLTTRPMEAEDKAFKNAIKDIAINHSTNMKTLYKIINYNKILLIALLIIVVAQGIILYILLIRKTHKISGPIFVMSNYMKEIIAGKFPNMRPLRVKDELKEFYDLFIEMVNKVKEKK